MDDSERRLECDRLIRKGSDEKLLRGSTERARKTLERARKLATRLGPPWSALAAYRLAHLAMREGELHAADEFFVEASKSKALGPWPAVFRLAAMRRLEASEENR